MSYEARLKELNITLPETTPPLFSYVPTVLTGNQLWVSGQIAKDSDGKFIVGKLGLDTDIERGAQVARLSSLSALAQVRKALGSLDNVSRIIKVVAFVAGRAGFTDMPKVANGASDVLVEIFGENGRHARSAIGVFELPFGAPVEVEVVVEVKAEYLASLSKL